MKAGKVIFYSAVLLGSMAFSSCTLNQMIAKAKQQKLTVTPSPLELHGGKVSYRMSALLPVKMLKSGTVYTVNNYYEYGGKSVEAGKVEFVASDFPNSGTEQPNVSRDFSFAYQPDMVRGDLVVQGVASKGKKFKTTPKMNIAKGVITTSMLVKDTYVSSYAESGYGVEGPATSHIEFYFLQGKSDLRVSEINSQRGKFLDGFISQKQGNTVRIIGTHSPEGAETVNSRLAEDRAKAIEKYYRKKMKEYGYDNLEADVKFELVPVTQDWGRFKETLAQNTSLSQEEKNAISEIVDGEGDFNEKQAKLAQLPYYKYLFNELYPKLRVARTEVLLKPEVKPNDEVASRAQQFQAGTLSEDEVTEEEINYAANMTNSLEEKERLYTAATKKGGSWQSHNNLGGVYIQMAQNQKDAASRTKYLNMAKDQLNISKNKKESPEVYTNMAEVAMMEGKNQEAQTYLQKADQLTRTSGAKVNPGLAATRGVAAIKSGNYDEAISNLRQAGTSPTVLYNLALAYLLKKDHANARAGFEKAIAADPKNSWAYYCAAITGARTGDEAYMSSNLSKAVKAERGLASKAADDLEFMNYWQAESFKNAVK